MDRNKIRFQKEHADSFFKCLNARVSDYFKTNKINPKANVHMVLKTILLIVALIIPYSLVLLGFKAFSITLVLLLAIALAKAGIALAVMHDANHGAYSKKPVINRLMGLTTYLVGISPLTWNLQHNNHHLFTNIYDVDTDVTPEPIVRLSPHAELKKIHRFQHLYAWPLYGIITIKRVFLDVGKLLLYKRRGIYKVSGVQMAKDLLEMSVFKVIYLFLALVLPTLLLGVAFWKVFLAFAGIHFIVSMILALNFQVGHLHEENHQPLPNEKGSMEDQWAVHQLKASSNYANGSKFLSWYLGGLNFQIEHHLFTHICHVHYPALSKIVQKTVKEFDLPYNQYRSLRQALKSHYIFLKSMGRLERALS